MAKAETLISTKGEEGVRLMIVGKEHEYVSLSLPLDTIVYFLRFVQLVKSAPSALRLQMSKEHSNEHDCSSLYKDVPSEI